MNHIPGQLHDRRTRRGGCRGAPVGGFAAIIGKVCISLFILFWMAAPTCDLLAMLRHGASPGPAAQPLFYVITAIFPLAGIAGLVAVWRRPRRPAMPPIRHDRPPDGEGEPGTSPVPAALPDAFGQPARRKFSFGDFIVPLFGLVFLLAGLFIGSIDAKTVLHHHAVEWRDAPGTILSSEVVHSDSSNGFSPHVTYRYAVDGQVYTNDALEVRQVSVSERGPAANRAAKYRPGAETTVHYNAADPAESTLEGMGALGYVLLLFPVPFIVFGAILFLYGLKNLLPDRTPVTFETALTGVRLRRIAGQGGETVAFTVCWCFMSFLFTFIWYTASGPFSWSRDYWTFDKFIVPVFPLIGICFAVSCVRTAIRRARIGRYEIEIACDRLRPGARVQATYSFDGDAGRLDRVVFSVERRNVAFRTAPADGGDPYAWRGDVVWAIDDPLRAQNGSFVFTVPPAVEGRRLQWRLIVKYAGLTDAFKLDVVSE